MPTLPGPESPDERTGGGDALRRTPSTPAERLARLRYIAGERMSGRTLEEIGAHLGVTRERVRQLERQAIDAGLHAAVGGAKRAARVADGRHGARAALADQVIGAVRLPQVQTLTAAAAAIGASLGRVTAALQSGGRLVAVQRLLAWRRRREIERRRQARRADIAASMAAFIAAHGRTPTAREMHAGRNGAPKTNDLVHYWGSLRMAIRSLGITPRALGRWGWTPESVARRGRDASTCARGHPRTHMTRVRRVDVRTGQVTFDCRLCIAERSARYVASGASAQNAARRRREAKARELSGERGERA